MIKKSKTIATKTNFLSITVLARKIFEIVFSTKTLKSEISESRVLEKRTTKSEKKHLNDKKKTFTRIRKRNQIITSTNVSSMIWWFIVLSIELFIILFVLYQSQQVYLLEILLKYIIILMICDDSKIRDWIKSLSKKKFANLNKKWK